jgi:tight adherence protein B
MPFPWRFFSLKTGEAKMLNAFLGLVVLLGIAGIAIAFRRASIRQLASDRLREPQPAGVDRAVEPDTNGGFVPQVFARRHYIIPWVIAAFTFAGFWWLAALPWVFASALAVIASLLAMQADAVWLAWRQDRIESQLADAIDLMVAAVKVGSSIQNALEYAAKMPGNLCIPSWRKSWAAFATAMIP